MSEEYSNGYARGYEAGQQSVLKLAEQPAQQQELDAIGCKCSVCGEWQRWTQSGMVCKNGHGGVRGVNHRLYTSPPARKPLTDEEKLALLKKHFNAVCVPEWFDALLLDIEAAHGIKGDA